MASAPPQTVKTCSTWAGVTNTSSAVSKTVLPVSLSASASRGVPARTASPSSTGPASPKRTKPSAGRAGSRRAFMRSKKAAMFFSGTRLKRLRVWPKSSV